MKKLCYIICMIVFATITFGLAGCGASSDNTQLSTYEIDVTFDEESKILAGYENVRYYNNTDVVLNNIVFCLYPNAFNENVTNAPVSMLQISKAYPNGQDYGYINILDVQVNTLAVEYSVGGEDDLFLDIAIQELYPQESVDIYIAFEEKLPNVLHRYGYGDDTYNFGNFFPIICVYDGGYVQQSYSSNGDPFYSDCASFNVNISYPDNLTLAHSGQKVSSSASQDMITDSIVAKSVRDFAFVLGRDFKTKSAEIEGTQITYFYFDDDNSDISLLTAQDAVRTFNELFGKYPYPTLSVVQANFIHGGMEYPNLVYISNGVTNFADYKNVIIHEIAHQWWYNVVGSNAFRYAWVDEGLTEYSTALFYECNPSYEVEYATVISSAVDSYQFFVEVYGEVYGDVDTTMTRALDEYRTEPEYVYNTYVKGMLLFDSIRDCVGAKKFNKALREYYKEYMFKIASPDDLIGMFEKICSSKVGTIFDSYINGKVKIISSNK